MHYNEIKAVLPHFAFEGEYNNSEEIPSGNVNKTYHLYYQTEQGTINQYVLQCINQFVFTEPSVVMHNISMVTQHVKKNLESIGEDAQRGVMSIIPTHKGETYYVDKRGESWRATYFIEGATAPDTVNTTEEMFEIGSGFGRFQRYLADFPAEELKITIPNFHNTSKRFYAFVNSIDQDVAGRVKKVEEEIEFFFERRKMMSEIVKLLDAGVIPLRVTHNDTKCNNVMLDNVSHKAVCVLDLDTVMPGSALYDYGDAVRFGASTAAEDEPDISKISLDMEMARAYTEGFVKETNGYLTKEELLRLPLGIKVITCELAMRFLKDYLDGDVYFKINSPKHNLIRARAQIALLKDIESKEDQLNELVHSLM